MRNPMLLFELVGLLLLRFATRQLFALLFQLPPRFTRFEPDGRRPHCFHHAPTEPLRAHRQDECRERGEPLLEPRFGDRTGAVEHFKHPQPPPVAHLAAAVECRVVWKNPVAEEIHAPHRRLRAGRMFQNEVQLF